MLMTLIINKRQWEKRTSLKFIFAFLCPTRVTCTPIYLKPCTDQEMGHSFLTFGMLRGQAIDFCK